jgi:dTMP kinase
VIKPRFISFEGGEGSGKSTQIKLLAKKLANYGDVITTREPGGTIEAEIIRNLLVRGEKNKWSGVVETLLLYAARKDHIDKVILPNLNKNKWVLCDRFKESTIVYQGYGKNVDIKLIKKLDKLITDNLTPSLTFILDIDPKIGLKRSIRKANTEIRYEKMSLSFHNKIRKAFKKIANANKRNFKLINANQDIDLIKNIIWNEVIRKIDAKK